MLESLRMLREIDTLGLTSGTVQANCKKIAEAIEHELADGWVELPKDAGGVPIHLGDKVCTKLGSIYTVARITREDYEGTTTWYIEDFASHYSLGPEDLTICKPSTVEDVLREFTDAVLEWAGKSGTVAEVGTWSDMAAQYAAKLRLANGEE